MKAKVETEDKYEALRIVKSEDMAHALWQIVHNGWRQFKHTDYDYEKAWDAIREILDDYYINVDELIEE